jgi:hypothetical protein
LKGILHRLNTNAWKTRKHVMAKHKTGTCEEWLAARIELLKAEKDLIRHSEATKRVGSLFGRSAARGSLLTRDESGGEAVRDDVAEEDARAASESR